MFGNRTPEQIKEQTLRSLATRKKNREEAERLREEENELIKEKYSESQQLKKQIEILKFELKKLENCEKFIPLSKKLTNKVLLTEEKIVESSVSWTNQIGVYFLIKNESIVYVGQSISIYARIASHKDKDFDSIAFVSCEKKNLDFLESLYIHCLNPKLNGDQHYGGKAAPMSLQQIIEKAST